VPGSTRGEDFALEDVMVEVGVAESHGSPAEAMRKAGMPSLVLCRRFSIKSNPSKKLRWQS
jgi:hypothetical protein